MKSDDKQRFDIALKSDNPEKALIALVEQMKAEKLSQVQIYFHFEERLIFARDEDNEEDYSVLADVMDFIVGYCSSYCKLFPHSLSNEEIQEYRQQIESQ